MKKEKKMKLSLTKKNIKNLSQDKKQLPNAITKLIAGGNNSSDTSVTSINKSN
jgi:hypothetical protein